jgi:predicted lipid carrier protein YhbT
MSSAPSSPPVRDHDVLARLRRAFRAEAADGVRLSTQIVLTGDPSHRVWVDVRDGRLEVGLGHRAHADVTFLLSADDFCGVLEGRENPDLLFLGDRLAVEGDLQRALVLRKLFRAPL